MNEIREITRYIPHHYPFVLVDKMVELLPSRGVGHKFVSERDFIFRWLWPAREYFPESLLIESMAQAAAAVVGMMLLQEGYERPVEGFLVRLDGFDFLGRAKIGEKIILVAEIIKRRGKLFRFGTRAEVDGNLIAKGELTFILAG